MADKTTADLLGLLHDIPVRKGMLMPLTQYGDNSARVDWTAGLPGSLWEAFTAPARAYRGEIPDEQMVPEGLNFAGSVALGSAAVPRPKGSVGMGSLKEGAAEPLRAYHGSGNNDLLTNPMHLKDPEGYWSPWGSSSRNVANSYARAMYPNDTPMIVPVEYRFNNPKVIDARGGRFDSLPGRYRIPETAFAAARDAGHDGLVIKNVRDAAAHNGRMATNEVAATYAPLRPGTTYSALSGDILYSNPKTSAAPGLGLMAAAKQEPKGFTAFHGSPHDFDRFDMSKIGTGEGAQAYGHGLYFADSEGVAKSYRDNLGGTTWKGAENMPSRLIEGMDVRYDVNRALEQANGDKARARQILQDEVDRATPGREEMDKAALSLFDEMAPSLMPERNGKMYQVRINADPEHFLDWDKPLSQQSEAVKAFFNKTGLQPYTIVDAMGKRLDPSVGMPKDVAEKVAAEWGGQAVPIGEDKISADVLRKVFGLGRAENEYTSQLRDAGIPGIKYLDQGSRAGGDGSWNYVVFDDKMIDILKKYGLLGMLGGGALASQPSGPGILSDSLGGK